MSAIKMPEHLERIRDAAVDYALGKGPLPTDIEELYHWLFWESEDDTLSDFEFFFSLSQLDRSDVAVRWELGLDNDAPIDDFTRISFARDRIARLVSGDTEDLVSAHQFKLERKDGRSTLACCTVQMLGQSRPDTTWRGFFPTREAFWDRLREVGCFHVEDFNALEDSVLLDSWHKG